MDSVKLKLTVAYDGTHYKGWQVQKSGVTVQQRVEEALRRLFPSVGRIHGSSLAWSRMWRFRRRNFA